MFGVKRIDIEKNVVNFYFDEVSVSVCNSCELFTPPRRSFIIQKVTYAYHARCKGVYGIWASSMEQFAV